MTPTTESDLPEQILKSDKLGRVRVPAERREAILDEFERSGMSGAAFAAHCWINYQTFATWRQRRRKRDETAVGSLAAGPGNFLLVEPLDEEASVRQRGDGLEIELRGGAWLRGGPGGGAGPCLLLGLGPEPEPGAAPVAPNRVAVAVRWRYPQ